MNKRTVQWSQISWLCLLPVRTKKEPTQQSSNMRDKIRALGSTTHTHTHTHIIYIYYIYYTRSSTYLRSFKLWLEPIQNLAIDIVHVGRLLNDNQGTATNQQTEAGSRQAERSRFSRITNTITNNLQVPRIPGSGSAGRIYHCAKSLTSPDPQSRRASPA